MLIVDDEPAVADYLADLIAGWGFETGTARDGILALADIDSAPPAVVISDVSMPRLDGFGLLREITRTHSGIPVILLTGQGSGAMAVRAIQEEGAFYYFDKPLDADASQRLRIVVERAAEFGAARRENEVLRRELRQRGAFGELIGNSEAMQGIYSLIEQVAPSSASVLITGESGTGKELVARTIHNLSPRAKNSFIAINCSAIPETLMESELFGHEKGAFTGAAARRLGCFELAHNGTLLLDEIAEMPVHLQAKLLRVLEERRMRRLGASQEMAIDARVLAATNKDPLASVANGAFREDLLYRLNVITIEIPPLRERKEDLPLLTQHLIATLAKRHERPARLMSQAALDDITDYDFPGNIRELRNIIERAVIICPDEQIERRHLAPYPVEQRPRPRAEDEDDDTITLPIGTPLAETEREMILHTLRKCDNNKTRAAGILCISLKTLHNKLRTYREQGLLDAPPSARSFAYQEHTDLPRF